MAARKRRPSTGESARVAGRLVEMARSPAIKLVTPSVTMVGASKPYLPVIAPAINIMASGACATAPKMVIVATTTKAVALMSMPGTALSMLGATIMPTITTTPLWLLWLSWPLLSLPMGGARSGACWTASASL
jgi:hypothetical protein